MAIKRGVSVLTITYGHEAYIAETIEGVLNQEVDFPIEMIIADDCSPDNTEKVVRHYIENHPNGYWIKYIKHRENKGMFRNYIAAFEQCRGKYIALCEGDDYWTDVLKLQKQVDFLEVNEEFNICYHNASVCSNGVLTNRKIYSKNNPIKLTFSDLLKGFYTKTCCSVIRNTDAFRIKVNNIQLIQVQDTTVFLAALEYDKKAYYIPEDMAVYRIHEGGIWSLRNEKSRLEILFNTFTYLATKYINEKYQKLILEKLKSIVLELFVLHLRNTNFKAIMEWGIEYKKIPASISLKEKYRICRKHLINKKLFNGQNK